MYIIWNFIKSVMDDHPIEYIHLSVLEMVVLNDWTHMVHENRSSSENMSEEVGIWKFKTLFHQQPTNVLLKTCLHMPSLTSCFHVVFSNYLVSWFWCFLLSLQPKKQNNTPMLLTSHSKTCKMFTQIWNIRNF